jgi:hypothetical protein
MGQSSLPATSGIDVSLLLFVANPLVVTVGIVAPNSGGRLGFDLFGGMVSIEQ